VALRVLLKIGRVRTDGLGDVSYAQLGLKFVEII
jgi:hypothetical protein